jgi:hypothetical protein
MKEEGNEWKEVKPETSILRHNTSCGLRKKAVVGVVLGLIIIVSLIALVLAFKTHKSLGDGEWVCIAEECVEWAYGNDWVKENCAPFGENKTMRCDITVDGKAYLAPLSVINLSNVKSCKEYKCVTEIMIKGSIRK